MTMIENDKIYMSFINGANEVMDNRMQLNKINVFPVADGDTGSNLFSTMQSIVKDSELKATIKGTLESIADSAIIGARGNSGLIFAQYFQGLSQGISSESKVSLREFVDASKEAMKFAYQAIDSPVEGTMLTMMKVFYESLNIGLEKCSTLLDLLENALRDVESAVEKTTDQLKVLKRSAVVDSGAKGFACFIRGVVNGFKGHIINLEDRHVTDEVIDLIHHTHGEQINFRYCTEALIQNFQMSKDIKQEISDLGDSLIEVKGTDKSRIHIHTNTPWLVFQRLSHFGHMIEQKVEDMVLQYDRVHNRKFDRVILTDSIADLPQSVLDDGQVEVIYLSLLIGHDKYFDKLTISNEYLLDESHSKANYPTSSQPSLKRIENIYNYLLSYYEEVLVFSVSSALSGTYNVFNKAAEALDFNKTRIHIVDTKQNSVGQGLLVLQAINGLKENMSTSQILEQAQTSLKKSKILVKINTLDNMVASGRLSYRKGKILSEIGIKPIVSLSKGGKGSIFKLAFGSKSSLKQIIKHMKKIDRTQGIKTYAVTYVDDQKLGQDFSNSLCEVLGRPPAYVTKSSGIIAVGAGRGAVAVGYILD